MVADSGAERHSCVDGARTIGERAEVDVVANLQRVPAIGGSPTAEAPTVRALDAPLAAADAG